MLNTEYREKKNKVYKIFSYATKTFLSLYFTF